MLAQERMARILVWFGGVASTVPMIYACLILWQLKADIYKLNRLSKTIDDLENKMSQMKKLSSTSSSPSPSDKPLTIYHAARLVGITAFNPEIDEKLHTAYI
ncbi:uncharacterized protein LOC106767160 isoform X2 [Vigna radiata var. radiata]|uniref:Uncharacterized protein LOC106767160 isoform X2 n=1 Tax=Vigna radiata var. radiata TaxID=3916 RepID=A0A1S3UNB5_VIGRR|nr:uncharacterized protein LOC106767160 isoform X2 [Vigna radiata var. radiata]